MLPSVAGVDVMRLGRVCTWRGPTGVAAFGSTSTSDLASIAMLACRQAPPLSGTAIDP